MPKKRNVNKIPDIQTRSGRSGKGFGSIDAAYREATKKTRSKHTVTTNYYVMMGRAIQRSMRNQAIGRRNRRNAK